MSKHNQVSQSLIQQEKAFPMAVDNDTQHSGLHDIKELAKSAKERIARERLWEDSDKQEDVRSLRMEGVAIPDPRRMEKPVMATATSSVFLPHQKAVPTAMGTGTTNAIASGSSDFPSVAGSTPVSSPFWANKSRSIVFAAIACMGVFIIGWLAIGKKEANTPVIAAKPSIGSTSSVQVNNSSNTAGNVNVSATVKATIKHNGTGDAAGKLTALVPEKKQPDALATTPSVSEQVVVADKEPKEKPVATAVIKQPTQPEARTTVPKGSATTEAKLAKKAVAVVDASKKPQTVSPKPKPPKKEPAPKSAEDEIAMLLDQATGGSKKPGSAAPVASGPTKTKLTTAEIKAKMRGLQSSTNRCYKKYKQAGSVPVRFTVDPSGKVTKAAARGSFAGTDSGRCVSSVVKTARFPAFSGRPQSFTFPFLLTP